MDTNSLLVAQQTPPGGYGRKLKKSDHRPISHRWFEVLSLHLSGKKVSEIKDATGYSEAMIYRILAHEDTLTIRQQLLKHYDSEFEALFPKVVDSIRKGLDSSDKYLDAASLWSRMSGKESKKGGQGDTHVHISAENVALSLLQQARETAQDAIDVTPSSPSMNDFILYEAKDE